MSSSRSGYITGGTWCVDHNMVLPHWPEEETATRILSASAQGGGAGCNFGVDIRRLAPEIPVATIGLCGEDPDGRLLRGVAAEHGIDTTRFHVDPALRTHRTMAFTSAANGKRTHIFEADSSDHLSPDHFDFAGVTARMLHLGLPGTHALLDAPWRGDPSGWVTVLKRARAAGLRTNMEVMSIPRDDLRRIILPCLPHLDYLVVNDYEIGAFADMQTVQGGATSVPGVLAALRRVMELGRMEIAVAHFPGGALALERSGAVHSHPSTRFPAAEVKGTNGAGDAFAAGFFCGHHRGVRLRDCLAHAHAAAAASLRSVDTYGAVESIEACLALAERNGWREALEVGAA